MTTETAERPTYGNWIQQRSPGLFGAGLIGTIVLFAALLGALFAMLIGGWKPAAVVGGIGVLGFTATGTPVGSWVFRRSAFHRARKAGDTRHRSGVFGSGRTRRTGSRASSAEPS